MPSVLCLNFFTYFELFDSHMSSQVLLFQKSFLTRTRKHWNSGQLNVQGNKALAERGACWELAQKSVPQQVRDQTREASKGKVLANRFHKSQCQSTK